jgi:hypothetical protein
VRILENAKRRVDDEPAQNEKRHERPGPPRIAALCLGESILANGRSVGGHGAESISLVKQKRALYRDYPLVVNSPHSSTTNQLPHSAVSAHH